MIVAIILAAGRSTRMGQPKMLLPWGDKTIIQKVVSTIYDSGIDCSIVVAGNNLNQLKKTLENYPVVFVINQDYASGDMLSSVKIGLVSATDQSSAALIVLGDQPQVDSTVVKEIIDRYTNTGEKIIIPSYKKHRGHPWLIDRSLWNSVLDIPFPKTLRDFLNQNHDLITYINVDNPSILEDLDTPEDYAQHRP